MTYSKDLRKRVLYLSTTFGFSTREIGHLVHLGKSTVARWMQQQYPNKNPQPKKKIGRQSKISAQIGVLIAKSLKDSPLLTLKQLQSRINTQCQKKFSISTLSLWLKHNGLTYKQSRCRIQGKSTLSEQIKFLDEIRKYSHSQIISLDEVGFQLEMHRQRGWSVRGKRCIYQRNGTRRQNYHGIFSIGTDGQVLYKIYDSPIKLGIFMTM